MNLYFIRSSINLNFRKTLTESDIRKTHQKQMLQKEKLTIHIHHSRSGMQKKRVRKTKA